MARILHIAALLLLATASALTQAAKSPKDVVHCDVSRSYIFVQVKKNQLSLCEEGRVVGQYRAAMGTGGAGKRRENDRKTPIGDYLLGEPRPSNAGFNTFIPVEYPTELQRTAGFTGGDIGIHGPMRHMVLFGRNSTARNWTRGCIALGADREIEEIAQWVIARQILTVSIVP